MITFDTGALIAVERRDRVMLAFMTTALAAGSKITVPSAVVGEWWRGQRGRAARILDAVHIEVLTASLAKRAGETLASCPEVHVPQGGGGTIVPGVYVLTEYVRFGGDSYPILGPQARRRETATCQ